ncbi:hypothetical protein Javan263_0041 [Streptococcus phage Javan263]|uniref:Phage protein n=2 Tax=Streptococcus infantarius TaxID=102684 RepID=A0A380KP73_9STRE|nr:hypothetical protein [Streptococcus infantarius]MCO4467218.1 hypothetical protein [Streptococcus infantarius subsp. infantarius]QBX16632.1 hypothetical protein Javan263_0041 [Streptococcus phage Javan263]EDT47251.1 hypothetical protein STRINF_01552 [Streptococcus infantarius subsp. infantarius ATCC BAA-102]QQB29655.1 hypothetical protein I6H76_02055 [Streptococcus infantarius]SUN68093.1 phage protein [Streptococcus infantarius]
MIQGKTNSGFKFEIDENQLKNYEFVELVAEVDENELLMPKLLKLLLGDQVEALKDHIRDESGIVPIEKMVTEIKDIFENAQVKNS